ncbi:MAG TPA: hypothetical protein VEA19_04260 [Actinomycetota bacterium]|nr:hypothetical protein [Actinomycetota bacterium]
MIRRFPILILALALSACGSEVTVDAGGGDGPRPTPSRSFPVGVSIPSELPTEGAPFLRSGTAEITIGGRQTSLQLSQTVPSTSAGGVVSLSYGEPSGGTFLNIAGQAHAGAVKTGPGFGVSLGDGSATLTALQDECTVTFEQIAAGSVIGSFVCVGLSAPGGDVDASGTFDAGS